MNYPTVNRDQEDARRRYQAARDKANQLGYNVWRNDVIEWVIASSPAECNVICAEQMGETLAYVEEAEHVWVPLTHDHVLNMHMDDGRGSVEQTCAEWIAEQGRGFLGSTEY